jgi:hypothetical protein
MRTEYGVRQYTTGRAIMATRNVLSTPKYVVSGGKMKN